MRFVKVLIFTLDQSDHAKCVDSESYSYELRHDKTNKMAVRQAKTQISPGIRPVWSESSLCA